MMLPQRGKDAKRRRVSMDFRCAFAPLREKISLSTFPLNFAFPRFKHIFSKIE
jgi:hypothetical protein